MMCTHVQYGAMSHSLVSSSLLHSLLDEIVVFSHNIVEWVFNALQDLPAALGIRKVQSESTATTNLTNIYIYIYTAISIAYSSI